MAEPDAAACNWTCTLQPERRLAACFSIPNAEYQRLDLLCAWQISGRYFFIRWFLLGILMVCMHRSHDHKVFHPLEVPQQLCPRGGSLDGSWHPHVIARAAYCRLFLSNRLQARKKANIFPKTNHFDALLQTRNELSPWYFHQSLL